MSEIEESIKNAREVPPMPHDAAHQDEEEGQNHDPYNDGLDFPDVGVPDIDPYNPETVERIRLCATLDQNDTDNGRRLIEWYGKDLLFVAGRGWHYWTGKIWDAEDGPMHAQRLAQQTAKLIKLEGPLIEPTQSQKDLIQAAERCRSKADKDRSEGEKDLILKANKAIEQISKRRSARTNFGVSAGNITRTKAMMDQASPHIFARREDLNKDDLALCVENGVIEFKEYPDPEAEDAASGATRTVPEIRHHDPVDLITRMAPVTYDTKAKCPKWNEFIERFQPSPEMRLFLQVWAGYSLLGGNGEQKLVFHYGQGSNGKSAYTTALARLMGAYHITMSPDSVSGVGQKQGSQHSADIVRLRGRRYVTVEELPKGSPLREELIKLFTGGTTITARDLFSGVEEFEPKFKADMMGNAMPQIMGTDYGIWRRLLIVPWTVQIPENERRPFDQVMADFDGERSGILNWLIDGAVMYLEEGLNKFIPPVVREFTGDYQEDRSPVHNFAEACLEPRPGERIKGKTMYDAFKHWCEESGINPFNQTTFGNQLREMGYKKHRGRVYEYLDVAFSADASELARDRSEAGF